MTEFIFEPLASHHDRAAFACGSALLDGYLQTRARQDVKRLAAAAFVMVPSSQRTQIAGYYTLSAGSIGLDEIPAVVADKMARYPAVPVTLLGRLARDLRFPGTGGFLLTHALTRAYQSSSQVAAVGVVVDAIDDPAIRFYRKFEFQPLPNRPNRLFLSMQTIEQWL
jgi:GNAT superfamily N-acetyltransferase